MREPASVCAIMILYLVHHADAVGPDVDPQRPLSTRGRAEAAALAVRAKNAGAAPAIIWHSGKLRARQTADAFRQACAPFASFGAVRGLLPDDPVEWMADRLAAESSDAMVVGHMPHIARLAHHLAPAAEAFPLHGVVVLDRQDDGTYAERWRASP